MIHLRLFSLLVIAGCLAAPSHTFAQTQPATHPTTAQGSLHIRAYTVADASRTSTPSESFQTFSLAFAELALTPRWDFKPRRLSLGAQTQLEAVRSASNQSLLGIDTNSIVTRVRRAYAFALWTPNPLDLHIQAGLIPDPWIASLQPRYDMRALVPFPSEHALFTDPSDLGASLRIAVWQQRVEVRASLTNGEGLNQTEQNDGKDTTLVVRFGDDLTDLGGTPLSIHAHGVWRDGSRGPASVPDHRLGAALTATHARAHIGLEWMRADGLDSIANLQSETWGVWTSAILWEPWLGIHARTQSTRPNTSTDASSTLHTLGVFADLIPSPTQPSNRFRLHAAAHLFASDPTAAPITGVSPLSEATVFTLRVESVFDASLALQPQPLTTP